MTIYADRSLTSPVDLATALAATGYLADEGLATAGFLAMRLGRPLFLEGEASTLAEQVQRLSRLVWVNPHRGKAGYEPLAGGMAAVLPYLDEFVAGHSLGALEELAGVIARA